MMKISLSKSNKLTSENEYFIQNQDISVHKESRTQTDLLSIIQSSLMSVCPLLL